MPDAGTMQQRLTRRSKALVKAGCLLVADSTLARTASSVGEYGGRGD